MNFFSKKMFAVSVVMTLYTDFFVLSEDLNSQKKIPDQSVRTSGSHQLVNANEYYNPDSSDFFSYVDYLCWKPVTEKLTWAAKESYNLKKRGESEKFLTQTYDSALPYSSGFRVGLGYRFSQDYFVTNKRPFQFEANYERIYSSASTKKKASGVAATSIDNDGKVTIIATQTLVPLLPLYEATTAFIDGSSHLEFGYNKGDISISWPLWVRNFLILRPYTGASFAYIESSWITKFFQRADAKQAFTSTSLKWSWRGGGLLGGISTDIEFGRGFGFWANAAFSLMYGNVKQYENYSLNLLESFLPPDNHIKSSRNFYSFQPLLKFGLGLNYKHWYKKMMLYSSLGWDLNYWIKLNQFSQSYISNDIDYSSRYFDICKSSYLILEGFSARLGLEF